MVSYRLNGKNNVKGSKVVLCTVSYFSVFRIMVEKKDRERRFQKKGQDRKLELSKLNSPTDSNG